MFPKNVVVIAVLVVCYVKFSYGVIEGSQVNTIKEDIKNETAKGERTGRTLQKECNGNFSAKCMKIQVLSFLEDLNSRDELSLPLPGLSIVKENTSKSQSAEELAAELSRQFPGKPEEKLNRYILHRLQDYLDGHSLRYRLLDPETTKEAMDVVDGENVETGRRRRVRGGAGGGAGGAMLAAGMMMKGALGAASLGAIALLAGKALMTALISLLLSALVGLKGQGGHKSTTYEIITKPEVSHHHSHSHEDVYEHEHGHHGGYKRAYDDGYNTYMPYDTASGTVKYE